MSYNFWCHKMRARKKSGHLWLYPVLDHLTKCNNFPTPYLHTFLYLSYITSSGLPFIKIAPVDA